MKKISVIFLIFTFQFVIGQTETSLKKANASKMCVSLGEYGSLMEKFIAKNNITKIQYINDGQFLGKEPYTFDSALLAAEIERAFPNPDGHGIAYIDLESPYIENLRDKDVNDESFQKSLKLFVDVIQFAKKMRPNAKWGYYAIPYTTYWDRIPGFYKKIKKIESLIKECDVFFPSLYIFYEDKDSIMTAENKKYVIENTKEIIKISKLYKKPALVFIWHRYHNSNLKVGNQFLPEKMFLIHIKQIINTTFGGQKVDGIVWWGSDNYSFRQKHKGVADEFKGSEQDYKINNDKVLSRLAKKQLKIINQFKKE